jgi:hypothetical protein
VNTPDSCFYAGLACSCLQAGGNPNNHKWGCYGTPNKCPDAPPMAGTSCKNKVGASCPYPGNEFCACVGNMLAPQWTCEIPNSLCTAKPIEGSLCFQVKSCSYGDVACFCDGSNWGCEGG